MLLGAKTQKILVTLILLTEELNEDFKKQQCLFHSQRRLIPGSLLLVSGLPLGMGELLGQGSGFRRRLRVSGLSVEV